MDLDLVRHPYSILNRGAEKEALPNCGDCGSNGVSGTDTLSDARRERCRDDDTGRCGEEEGE